MKKWFVAFIVAGALASVSTAQQDASKPVQQSSAKTASAAQQYSGMYSFLKDGEFVQLNIEEDGNVTGSISRYADEESGAGEFLDQFIKTGKLDGAKLTFSSEVVRGTGFAFEGTVERGEGKTAQDEAYYILKGNLKETSTDANKKETSHSREVVLKKFPQEPAAK